jgi:release factor glutamine methyltransferase
MIHKDCIYIAKRILKIYSCEENDAKRIIEASSGKKNVYLYLKENHNNLNIFLEMILKRVSGVRFSRIVSKKEFWSMDFEINEHTLDPREDTEILVELALKYSNKSNVCYILDLGTGTGCCAISFLSERAKWRCVGVDKSNEAIKVAKRNSEVHKISDRVKFIESDWFSNLDSNVDIFDIIISNPPYVPLNYPAPKDDPDLALYAGKDGLDAYKIIIPEAYKYLKEGGVLIVEIGYDQRDSILNNISQNNLKLEEVVKDYSGNDRCIVFKKLFGNNLQITL